MTRLNPPVWMLLLMLLLVHAGLWLLPVQRSLHFYDYAADVHDSDASINTSNDLNYARWLRNAYFAAAGVSLAYAVIGSLCRRRLVLALWAVQWLLPLWLIWRRPEEVIVFIPSLAPLITATCALIFGIGLVFVIAAVGLRLRRPAT